ncbi:MAG: hypothetical protein KJ558_04435 [Gammaproteobacteria bacterium]|nr:hypothetical protein [Gammaproteobacteria bacterium]MBU1654068.1 hypothetical protein [Gammaproteobacteria bacterium]MBU1962309.1 hypothetical protein [Gammaproteobacteria bacterium]
MSKKKQKGLFRSPKSNPPEQNIESALSELQSGRFRDAIDLFKTLLKQGPNQEAKEGLAAAYAGRAMQLSAKGMDREALVIWQNRAALGGVEYSIEYVRLLLRLGRINDLLPLYRRLAADESAADLRRLMAEYLAAFYLAGEDAIADTLAEDDPLRTQGGTAREALRAYCEGDDEGVQRHLAGIPFRSPFRDFVQIIKALMLLPEGPEKAAELLDRVKEDSAFADLRRAALNSLLPEQGLMEILPETEPASRDFIFALKGWNDTRRQLWQALHKPGVHPGAKSLFALMHRHRQAMGNDWAQRQGLRLLLQGRAQSGAWLREIRCAALSTLETAQINAWMAEEHSPWTSLNGWEDYVAALGEQQIDDRSLRIALALRRTDNLFDILGKAAFRDEDEELAEAVVEQLERSLAFDPDDRQCHLRLIAYYRRTDRLKSARAVLKPAQERWPEDKAILTAAMEIALAGGAYKKAAGIARDILAVDPINNGIRERLVESHLAHARKHLRGSRPDLAEKSLVDAEQWSSSERSRQSLELLRAFILLTEDSARGKTALRALTETRGNGLNSRLILALEAQRNGLDPTRLLQQLDLLKIPRVDRNDLLAFFRTLREHLDGEKGKPARDLAVYLAVPLKQAAKLRLERNEFESACETLRRADLQPSRLAFAQAALILWQGDPLFVLHAFQAKHENTFYRQATEAELDRLEQALYRANTEGNTRLSHQIGEQLNDLRYLPYSGPSFLSEPPESFRDEDEDMKDFFHETLEMLKTIVRTIGIKAIRQLVNDRSDPLGDIFRNMQRSLGKQVFETLIGSLARGDADERFPEPPQPKSRKGRPGKPKQQTKDNGQGNDEDELSDQLDMFK